MKTTETVQDFYARLPHINPSGLSLNNAGPGHFNVFPRSSCQHTTFYSRRDFYKVSLVIGTGRLHYADKWIEVDRPALLFSNPMIPYSWEAGSAEQEGWFCLFTEAFVHSQERKETLQDSPLFKVGGTPIFFIDEQQLEEISFLFKKMTREMDSD
ncbi:AraC family transcriptional regulator, partial [Pedobacter sp. HMWF019]